MPRKNVYFFQQKEGGYKKKTSVIKWVNKSASPRRTFPYKFSKIYIIATLQRGRSSSNYFCRSFCMDVKEMLQMELLIYNGLTRFPSQSFMQRRIEDPVKHLI